MSENTLLYYLKKSEEFLQKKGIPSPRVDAEWILADLLGLSRIRLYAKFDMPLGQSEILTYRERIVERGKFKPVAYITGKKGFHKFDFFVNEHTLIPRPETEELVDYIFKNCPSLFPERTEAKSLKVWDLCSGSGNIGLSLSKLLQIADVTLSDISEPSIQVSKKNAEHLGVLDDCHFFQSDLGENLPESLNFDLIVSNPPYIPFSEKSEMMPDVVDYEPHIALFVEDFIIFHKKLLSTIYSRLSLDGRFFLETHPKYIHELESLTKEMNFEEIQILKDTSDKNRFLTAKKTH